MPVIRIVASGLRCSIAAVAILVACLPLADAAEIDRQREIFKRVYADVERGNWSVVDALSQTEQRLLSEYVLWPDLRAVFFRATMTKADHDDVEAFLDQHGVLRPARSLRYRYAVHLAAIGDLPGYLSIYQRYYQGMEDAKLDCLALHAEIDAGRHNRVVTRATDLWMIGKSQVDECNPVFEYLDKHQLLGPADYQRRFDLAVAAREFSRARWLAKSIDQRHVDMAGQWLEAQGNPVAFVRGYKRPASDEPGRRQLVYAIERITYRNPELALELWQQLRKQYHFDSAAELRTSRHIALWTARDQLPNAYALLIALPAAAQSDEVLRWRARTSLRNQNWNHLLTDIKLMSASERNSEEWRYWHGIALLRTGDQAAARLVLDALAQERSFYGFLAADELGLDYALVDTEIVADETVIAELANRPSLVRARELFLVGLDGRGRSEWDAVIAYLSPQQKTQAAILASRWQWHSRAIAAAASVGEYDDLSLRYPLPYEELFRRHAAQASISTTWAYGIARSESLFMRDVRSSAGAIGLMQLMPATGRQVAREIKLPYSGIDTLTNPQHNIRLGTSYLGKMVDRFGGNRVLATAAYNAGPHRVDRWLPETGTIDARIWIENIPFNETRKYVRRVLAAETIFHWRLTGRVRRLSDELLVVQAHATPERVARY